MTDKIGTPRKNNVELTNKSEQAKASRIAPSRIESFVIRDVSIG